MLFFLLFLIIELLLEFLYVYIYASINESMEAILTLLDQCLAYNKSYTIKIRNYKHTYKETFIFFNYVINLCVSSVNRGPCASCNLLSLSWTSPSPRHTWHSVWPLEGHQ